MEKKTRITSKCLELIGLIIGDKCIFYYPQHRVYGLEIAGNANDQLYSIYLSGHNAIEKWHKEIAFCGRKNIKKYEKWKTFKYYDSNLSKQCRRSQAVRQEIM